MLLNVPNGRPYFALFTTLAMRRRREPVRISSIRYRRLPIIHGGCKTGTDRVVYSVADYFNVTILFTRPTGRYLHESAPRFDRSAFCLSVAIPARIAANRVAIASDAFSVYQSRF